MAVVAVSLPCNSQLYTLVGKATPVNSRITTGSRAVVMIQGILATPASTLSVNSWLFSTLDITSRWNSYSIQCNSLLQQTISLNPLLVNAAISDYAGIEKRLRVASALTDTGVASSREVNTTYRIYFDGEDVTSKISTCRLSYSKDSFCGQVDIEWKDWSFFTRLDPADLITNFKRERFSVYVNDVLLGNFLNEKRDVSVSFEETNPTSWGRTKTAFLSSPYSLPVTPLIKSWDTDTTARAICEELAAIENISMQWGIMDFKVRGGKMVMDSEYPIDGIVRLVSSVGGIVTTSRFSPILVVRYKWLGEVR